MTIREGEEEEEGKKRCQEEGIHEYRKVEPDRNNWPKTFRKKEAESRRGDKQKQNVDCGSSLIRWETMQRPSLRTKRMTWV